MKKYDVVVAVAKSTGVTQKEVEKVIDSLSSVIVENVRDGGDTINLPALGMFKQKNNPARMGRNPLTGEAIAIKESRTITFKPTQSMKVIIEPAAKKKK